MGLISDWALIGNIVMHVNTVVVTSLAGGVCEQLGMRLSSDMQYCMFHTTQNEQKLITSGYTQNL